MKAFVSYSIIDRELYIVSLLFEQLRKSGYVVETSTLGYTSGKNSECFQIQNSEVFIGIITNNSGSINHVINEWDIARQCKVKNILIIEDGVKVENSKNLNFVRFNRDNPSLAINKLFKINKPIKKETTKTLTNSNVEDALIVGGIIVGIAALISLLSESGNKK